MADLFPLLPLSFLLQKKKSLLKNIPSLESFLSSLFFPSSSSIFCQWLSSNTKTTGNLDIFKQRQWVIFF